MEEARKGGLKRFNTIRELMADLNEGDAGVTDDHEVREAEERMRSRIKELREKYDATPMGSIRKRIQDLQRGPERLDFVLVHDKERGVWLAEQEYWTADQGEPIAAEGATPSEVLRKLAELME